MRREEILARMGDERERVEQALNKMAPKAPEYRLAILTCQRALQGCPGATCLWAFQEKQYHFEQYRDSELPVRLCAFFPCNGCDADYESDPKLLKKIERLVLERVDKVHLGNCMKNKCKNIDKICELLTRYGLEYELGTH